MNFLFLENFRGVFPPPGTQTQNLQMNLPSASLGPGNSSLFPNSDVPVDSIKQWLPRQSACE